MKKAAKITFGVGSVTFLINQILVIALLNMVRNSLNITNDAPYGSAISQYILVILGILLFIVYMICICIKKISLNQVGAIFGIILVIICLLFSWVVVTGIFGFGNLIACSLILTSNIIILKVNKEIM